MTMLLTQLSAISFTFMSGVILHKMRSFKKMPKNLIRIAKNVLAPEFQI